MQRLNRKRREILSGISLCVKTVGKPQPEQLMRRLKVMQWNQGRQPNTLLLELDDKW